MKVRLMKYARIVLLFVLLVVLIVSVMRTPGCDLTEVPPPSDANLTQGLDETPISVVGFTAQVPISRLKKLAEERIPLQLVDETRTKRWKGKFLGIKTSTKAKLTLRIERRGKLKVKAQGNELQLIVPMKFKARIKGRSSIRPNTSTHGRFTVTVKVRLGIAPNWEPQVKVVGDYQWDKKPRVGSGIFSVDISDEVGDKLEEALTKGAEKLEEDLREDLDLRPKAEKAWLELQQPRQLSDDQPIWLVTEPESIHLAPLDTVGGNLQLSFALAARLKTVLGEPSVPETLIPLPALSPEIPQDRQFLIDLPIAADYAVLESLLMERLEDRELKLREGTAQIKAVHVYGSSGQLVVGADFSAQAPWRVLDSQGSFWLMGRPEFDPLTETLVIRDLDFTRRVNNPLVWTASWVLQDRLRAELRQRSVFSLSERITQARQKLVDKIADLGDEEWQVDGEVYELTVVDIEPRGERLLLRLRTKGRIEAEWQPERL